MVDETIAASEFGWRCLPVAGSAYDDWRRRKGPDEELISDTLCDYGARANETGGRNNSHDLEVTLGIDTVPPGFYEVKRLSARPGGKSFDPRFKAGRRGETIYGRRDAEIKSFAIKLESFLDECLWGREAVESAHDFIDQALQRRHGKKFHERLLRLAKIGLTIPDLIFASKDVIKGGVHHQDISAGFSGLKGIFLIAGHNYTLINSNEYKDFIGFDSASAEGPKLAYKNVIPLQKIAKKAKGK